MKPTPVPWHLEDGDLGIEVVAFYLVNYKGDDCGMDK